MLLTRQNPRGGPALTGFPICEDADTGVLGYKVGYCGCGCGEELLIRTIDVRHVVASFGIAMDVYEEMLGKKAPREPIRNKIIKFLGGKVD